eukprot:6204176-Pleurochrysis_carterae.AAC.5
MRSHVPASVTPPSPGCLGCRRWSDMVIAPARRSSRPTAAKTYYVRGPTRADGPAASNQNGGHRHAATLFSRNIIALEYYSSKQ